MKNAVSPRTKQRLSLRENSLLQYSLVMLAVVAVVSVALAFGIDRQISDYVIRSHVRLYPEIVRLACADEPAMDAVFRAGDPSAVTPEIGECFAGFTRLGNVFRVKVWATDGTILWSDQRDLIGMSFADDERLRSALTGVVSYQVGEPSGAENLHELTSGTDLEIYVPVKRSASTIGVIELYESDTELFDQIARSTRFTWISIAGAGIFLYVLLVSIFARSSFLQKKTHAQLDATQDVTIYALAYQADMRDQQTGRHLERSAQYVRILAEDLATSPEHRAYLTPRYIEDLVRSAPLHDIGKVGVPDTILLKPGGLTPAEMEQMKLHCEFGARTLQMAQEKLPFQSFLTIAIQLALYHHELWDGTGYPRGLRGAQIPLPGRIMALADKYDALRTARPYKEAMSHEACRELIVGQAGASFDPVIVQGFLRRAAEFGRISDLLADAG